MSQNKTAARRTSKSNQISYSVTNDNNSSHKGCLSQLRQINLPKHKLYRSDNLSAVFFAVSLLLLLAKSVNSSSTRFPSPSDDSTINSIRKNCTKCSLLLEDAKIRRLEEFKRDFLHKLGFKEAPKVTVDKSLYNIPPFDSIFAHRSNNLDGDMMLGDQPLNFAGDEGGPVDSKNDLDDSTGSIKRVISFAKLPPKSFNVSTDWNAQYFQFAPSLANSHISRATLWIQVRRSSSGNEFKNDEDEDEAEDSHLSHSGSHSQFQNRNKASRQSSESGANYGWIVVDQLRSQKSDHSDPSLFHVRSRRIHITSGTSWVKLSVKKLVNQWIHAPKGNLGLVIHVYDSEGRILPIGSAGSDKYTRLQVPFIELKMDYLSQNRHKRLARENFCDAGASEERPDCCLYPFQVDFKQFGWDWVIAPTLYQANYCTGECHEFDSNTYLHVMKQAKGSHSRCCVPKKTSDLQIIYVDDDGNLYSKVIPDMKIEKCGCA